LIKLNIFKNISTLGPIGYLPAPGTWASMITLVIIYWLHLLHISTYAYALFIFLSCIVAWYAVVYSLDYFRTRASHRQMGKNWGLNHDPSEIIIDEVVGCLITFFMVPLTIKSMIFGFILFRFFDIFKPCGLKMLEGMGGAWGILLDDIGAGILSNLILQVLLYTGIL